MLSAQFLLNPINVLCSNVLDTLHGFHYAHADFKEIGLKDEAAKLY